MFADDWMGISIVCVGSLQKHLTSNSLRYKDIASLSNSPSRAINNTRNMLSCHWKDFCQPFDQIMFNQVKGKLLLGKCKSLRSHLLYPRVVDELNA